MLGEQDPSLIQPFHYYRGKETFPTSLCHHWEIKVKAELSFNEYACSRSLPNWNSVVWARD